MKELITNILLTIVTLVLLTAVPWGYQVHGRLTRIEVLLEQGQFMFVPGRSGRKTATRPERVAQD